MNKWQNISWKKEAFSGLRFPDYQLEKIKDVQLLSIPDASLRIGKLQWVFDRPKSGRGAPILENALADLFGQSNPKFNGNMDALGCRFSFSATADFLFVSIVGLSDQLMAAWGIMVAEWDAMYVNPERFAIWKQQQKEMMQVTWSKGKNIASFLFRNDLLKDYPKYADVNRIEDEDAVEMDDVVALGTSLRSRLKALNVVGNVSDEVLSAVKDWITQKEDATPEFSAIQLEGIQMQVEQHSFRFGKIIGNKQSPDFSYVYWFNMMFGGFFGSRLNKIIREEKGLTYGIHSSLMHCKDISYWNIQSEIKVGSGDEVLKTIEEEIATLDQWITSAFFERTRSYVGGNIGMQFDSVFSVGDILLQEMLHGGTPEGYLKRWDNLFQKDHAEVVQWSQENVNFTTFKSLVFDGK